MDYFYTAPFIWEPEAVLVWRRRPRGSSHTNHALTALNHLNHRPHSPKNHTELSRHCTTFSRWKVTDAPLRGLHNRLLFSFNFSLQKSVSNIYYVANWTASILYMETVDRLYTTEQMWGHQSQSAPLKQLKQWDAFFLHDSASPNLDKQSSDHSDL